MHAWVLMTNHFHLIYSCTPDYDPPMVLKNIKSYTALKIIDAIININFGSMKIILYYWIVQKFLNRE